MLFRSKQPYRLKLAYPEVKARDRKAWTVTEGSGSDSDKLVFSLSGASAAACQRFERFWNPIPKDAPLQQWQVSRQGDRLTVTVPKADIERFSQVFSLDALSRHDDYTRPSLSPARA